MSKSKLTRKLIEGAVEANFTEFFVKFIEHNLYDWEIPDGYNIESEFDSENTNQTKIIRFKGFDLYVAVEGTYDSYEATEWYNCYFVKPAEVKVVRFERVK